MDANSVGLAGELTAMMADTMKHGVEFGMMIT